MFSKQIQAFWNGEALTENNGYRILFDSDWVPNEDNNGPRLSVESSSGGFQSVLALPPNKNRIQALRLENNPSPGVYIFESPRNADDFQVRLEFTEEPFPKPRMRTLDLTTDLRLAQVGDEMMVRLRKDVTTSPGVIRVDGTIVKIADSCGLVPNSNRIEIDRSESPVMSFLLDTRTEDTNDTLEIKQPPFLSSHLEGSSNTDGVLDVVGGAEPLELQWRGEKNTPSLLVESVTVKSADDDSWTVQNETLPEIDFTPLTDLSVEDRMELFETAFARDRYVSISDAAVELIAESVTGIEKSSYVTIRYDSPRSNDIQVKQGDLKAVEAVYYATPNRARYRIRFENDSEYYLLVDPVDDESPVSIYSTAESRHYDSDLGEVREIDIEITS